MPAIKTNQQKVKFVDNSNHPVHELKKDIVISHCEPVALVCNCYTTSDDIINNLPLYEPLFFEELAHASRFSNRMERQISVPTDMLRYIRYIVCTFV